MTDQQPIDQDAVELAACPFCGGEASLVDNRPIGLCYCMCDQCDAQCGGGWESDRLAREEWNRRASPPVPAGDGACERCGGRGEIGGAVGQTAEAFEWVTEPCPDCTPAGDEVSASARNEPGCQDCVHHICRDCDPCASPEAGFWKEPLKDAHPPQGEAEMRDGLVRLREWLLQLPIPTPGVVPQIRNVDAILALTGRGKGDE